MIPALGKPPAISPNAPMQPYWVEIVEIVHEAPGVSTFWLQFQDKSLMEGFHFKAGQFNMLSVPGLGEVAISISSDMEEKHRIGHTIRSAGNVTSTINRMNVGDILGVRGPFGNWWRSEEHTS